MSFSGGQNYVEFLTATYNDSLLLTYDIAVAGASVDSNIVAPVVETTDFVGQIDMFNANAANRTRTGPWTGDNSLFVLWFAVNDVNLGYDTVNGTDALNKLYDTDLGKYFELIEGLYNAGARNFAILNCPRMFAAEVMLSCR